MALTSLYRRILGAQFDALPAILQQFHDAPGGGRAHGQLQVERTPGWLRNQLAGVLRLPKSATQLPVRLEVIVEGDRERWLRHFGSQRVETVEWASDGLLMESYRSTVFSSRLVLDGSCLRYEFERAWLLGIPLPRFLSPNIEGTAEGGKDGWRVDVRIGAPLLGPLVHYGGWMSLG